MTAPKPAGPAVIAGAQADGDLGSAAPRGAPPAHHTIILQLDVASLVSTGNDPVACIKENPGRIRSIHLKDWSPENGYKVLFGEGKAPWKKIFAAAESVGGVEYYLIEQEGSQYPELETVERCLKAYKALRA